MAVIMVAWGMAEDGDVADIMAVFDVIEAFAIHSRRQIDAYKKAHI
jgi:hypothetical protein